MANRCGKVVVFIIVLQGPLAAFQQSLHFFSTVHFLHIFPPPNLILPLQLNLNKLLGVGNGPTLNLADLLDIKALLGRIGGTTFVRLLRVFFLIDD